MEARKDRKVSGRLERLQVWWEKWQECKVQCKVHA